MIFLAIASIPERIALLQKVVTALRPQVDTLRVYLNNFESIPDFLFPHEGLLATQAMGDIGAEGKFYWFDKETYDYYLTADDDLLYPSNYVETLIKEFEARHRKAIIGVHGFVFDTPIESYNQSRKERYKCTRKLSKPQPVHVLGTATTIFHPETIQLSMSNFPRRNMVDLQLAITAQQQQVPLVVIPREANWIQELEDPSNPVSGSSIWKSVKNDNGKTKADIARTEISEWKLFPDPI